MPGMVAGTPVAMPGADGGRDTGAVPLSSWLALAAIVVVAIYSIVDRQIFVLFAEAIRKEMLLSDTQVGLVQGVGLALVGVITTYPISWLADRYDRRWIVAGCVILWSVAIVICAAAPSFGWLFVGAALVGIGEAGVGPAGFAMIPDLFPQQARQLANSVFAIATRLGGAFGAYVAGMLGVAAMGLHPVLPSGLQPWAEWRLAFLLAVVFLPVAVALILLLPRRAAGTPVQMRADARGADAQGVAAPGLIRFVRQHARAQCGVLAGQFFMTFGLVSVAAWIPIVAQRDFGQTPAEGGAWLGAMAIVTGLIGFTIGTIGLRVLQPRFGARLPMLAVAGTIVVSALCSTLIGLFGRSVMSLYVLWGFQAIFLMIASMVLPTIMQNMTPVHLRARVFAMFGLVGMLAGGFSPPLVGLLSDALGTMPHKLLIAAMSVSVVALLIAAVIFVRMTSAYVRLAAEIAE